MGMGQRKGTNGLQCAQKITHQINMHQFLENNFPTPNLSGSSRELGGVQSCLVWNIQILGHTHIVGYGSKLGTPTNGWLILNISCPKIWFWPILHILHPSAPVSRSKPGHLVLGFCIDLTEGHMLILWGTSPVDSGAATRISNHVLNGWSFFSSSKFENLAYHWYSWKITLWFDRINLVLWSYNEPTSGKHDQELQILPRRPGKSVLKWLNQLEFPMSQPQTNTLL